jgi:hypothetical protein
MNNNNEWDGYDAIYSMDQALLSIISSFLKSKLEVDVEFWSECQ